MTSSSEQSNLLRELNLIEKLKKLIISEARAIFSVKYPSIDGKPRTFDVVTEKHPNKNPSFLYEAYVIVYSLSQSTWTCLLVSEDRKSAVEAMSDLLEAVYLRAGSTRGSLEVGEDYEGEEESEDDASDDSE
ncbi:hypothetical protein NX059_006661 [Plenodomus lindquistii]|nr:hypothetical protein NX059_006661 [Plenodomus lindquistii]